MSINQFFIKMFGIKHQCLFREREVILNAYKDSLKTIYEKYNMTPVHWDKVKNWTPSCIKCGKPYRENNEKP